MKVLLIGSGGREHALAWKLAQSPRLTKLYCAPGNAGIAEIAECVPIAADDVAGLKAFAQGVRIDLTMVGPEAPLALGIVDEFRKNKLKIFGPTRDAARLESSKTFTKEILVRQGIPTAAAKSFEALEPALRYLESQRLPIVIKADGLAQGKGVVVAQTMEEARAAVRSMLGDRTFGEAGARVVIEEFLAGEEVTIMAFTDGKTVVPMVPAQDHKRVGDGDTGPNTGGMGAYAPAPIADAQMREAVRETVLLPVVEAMSRLGSPFQGVLYAGLMIVDGRPYVLEFNARFGDPETQVVLPLLESDLLDVLEAVVEHRLDQIDVRWRQQAAVCIVLAAGGYPGSYKNGMPIHGLGKPRAPGVTVFHAGTKRSGNAVVTAGGRVLGVTAVAPDHAQARSAAYAAAESITFDGCHYRKDIASRVAAVGARRA